MSTTLCVKARQVGNDWFAVSAVLSKSVTVIIRPTGISLGLLWEMLKRP